MLAALIFAEYLAAVVVAVMYAGGRGHMPSVLSD
jgi:hypothetical protein